MPLVPIMFRDWWDDCYDVPLRTSRLMDQHFGSGITAEDLLTALTAAGATHSALQGRNRSHRHGGYHRPWRHSSLAARHDSGSTVELSGDKFQVNLDVQQFSPEEITVKATDKSITVEGKHEEKQDEHGYVTRHFVRRYMLPAGHDHEKIASSLSSDGILTISAPKLALPEPPKERTVPIVQTGQPLKQVREAGEKMETESSAAATKNGN